MERWAEDCFWYAIYLTGNTADAEDLVSEAMVRALQADADLDDSPRTRNYLFRVIRNLFYDQQDRQRTERNLLEAFRKESDQLESSALELAVAALEKKEREALVERIHDEVARLPDAPREVIELRFLADPRLRFREIAALQESSESTTYERMITALRSLAKAIAEDLE